MVYPRLTLCVAQCLVHTAELWASVHPPGKEHSAIASHNKHKDPFFFLPLKKKKNDCSVQQICVLTSCRSPSTILAYCVTWKSTLTTFLFNCKQARPLIILESVSQAQHDYKPQNLWVWTHTGFDVLSPVGILQCVVSVFITHGGWAEKAR